MSVHHETEHRWLGALSMSIALDLQRRAQEIDDHGREMRRTLTEFLHSPVASSELRRMVESELPKEGERRERKRH